jgi:DNA-binding response OmpR family regulator
MKPLALIIEDDPAIRESLADRLESLGHDCQAVGAQNEAGERIERCAYGYILLDLELPVRFGRPPSIQIGKNILQSIRASARNKDTPVIVVTAHGHDRPDLAVELMKAGAVDFVKKPFDNLEQAIREALQRRVNGNHATGTPNSGAPIEMRSLENGKLVFKCDAIELDGIEVCSPDSGTIWRILMLLRQRKDNGQPKAFGGKDIANHLGLNRGQNAVCEAVSKFRKRVIQLCADVGIEAMDDSVIIRGRAGYQINAELVVEDQADCIPEATIREDGDGPSDRQQWIVEELKKGRKLRRCDLEKKFGISMATAKRDFGDLAENIEFIGTGKAGYYELSGRGR